MVQIILQTCHLHLDHQENVQHWEKGFRLQYYRSFITQNSRPIFEGFSYVPFDVSLFLREVQAF